MRPLKSGYSRNHFPAFNPGRRALMKSTLLGGGAAAAGAILGGLIPRRHWPSTLRQSTKTPSWKLRLEKFAASFRRAR